ncbi:MAG: hypothetical protein Kow0022_10240 [Phycisphaerales bacterium]
MLAVFALSGAALAGGGGRSYGTFIDPAGDAVFRRTDEGNNGLLPTGIEPIDLLAVDITAWQTATPTSDPYAGTPVEDGDLVRITMEFAGVVAPPGPLGIGQAGSQYDPFRFGARPVYGFVGLDIDDQKNSGGELWQVAQNRYLANVGRFGMTPHGSIAERVAVWREDLDTSFYSDPQYERTGADFSIEMCGCWVPTIIAQDGNADGQFDAGETWIIQGRFLARGHSFEPLSGLFGGSDFGAFDPLVNVRWRHDPGDDRTIVELVFPLTMHGAALLAGQADQPVDLSLFNHTSMEEALADLIDGAEFATGELRDLWREWRGQDIADYLHPLEWKATALIGTTYAAPEPDARYVWTDVGFGEVLGDVDGSDAADAVDRAVVSDFLATYDGSAEDCDAAVDGKVTLCAFSNNFCLYDFDADGVVGPCDVSTLGRGADLNADGLVDFFDVSAFLQAFSAQAAPADWNADGLFDFFDVSAYLQVFSSGCP